MTQYTLLTVIVPAETVQTYRGIAADIHPAGAGMFLTPLYTGEELTHYISTGLIDSEVAPLLNDPEAFAEHYGIPVEQAEFFRGNFPYLAIGEGEALHGLEALGYLGLSLSVVTEDVGD